MHRCPNFICGLVNPLLEWRFGKVIAISSFLLVLNTILCHNLNFEVVARMCNYIPRFYVIVITYPWSKPTAGWDRSHQLMESYTKFCDKLFAAATFWWTEQLDSEQWLHLALHTSTSTRRSQSNLDFSHYWSSVRGIQLSGDWCGFPNNGSVMLIFDVFCIGILNNVLNKQSSCRWCETTCHSSGLIVM